MASEIKGPHQQLPANDARERFALELFDHLWNRYRQRVSYVRTYEQIVLDNKATFFNDHIALRTFANQNPFAGISSISRVFEALGYRAANNYHFEDKHLNATHYQHSNPQFPKVFISELRVWELSSAAREIIQRLLARRGALADTELLAGLSTINEQGAAPRWMPHLVSLFHDLPWNSPEKEDVLALNQESQYAAWVAVHGNNVNHFTSLINSHLVESLNSIEKTIDALRNAGVPLKESIEGAVGSKLRQSATEAVMIDVPVSDGGQEASMPWTYAYFELAERGNVVDRDGNSVRFEGFLGPQATQLFEMTRVD